MPGVTGPTSLNRSVLGVLDVAGVRVGVGFLLAPDLALTCAHVVDQAVSDGEAGPGTTVTLDLPLVPASRAENGIRSVRAVVERWQPPADDGSGDIAVLRLQETLAESQPVRMVEAADVWGHLMRAFGFPVGRDFGVWHAGRLLGRQAAGWIQAQLEEPSGYRIERGFSGAPVWDDELGGVVGMVVAAERSTVPAAYLIPTETLLGAWPDLRALMRPASPYRGLAPFRESDQAVFFGRSAEIAELAELVDGPGPVTVVGPSGCGKSSLVFAGLLPVLRNRGHRTPTIVTFRPSAGRTVYTALAAALLPVLEPSMSEVDRLREVSALATVLEAQGLADVVTRVLELTGAPEMLLVLDQGEELLAQHPEQVERFAEQLLGSTAPSRLQVLSTLRADFLDAALSIPALSGPLRRSVYTVGAMTAEQLRAVVTEPGANIPGVGFQDGLIERILTDVGTDPGALPLLSLTLTLLWERQSGGRLTHDAYDDLGRVSGSLGRYAEEVWSRSVQTEDAESARQLFVQLVRASTGGEVTRRVATRDDLGGPRWELAQRLATTRLLVTGQDAEGSDTVELAHEALVAGWSRLRTWIDADREFRIWQEELRADLARWSDAGCDPDLLIRGSALTVALRWVAERPGDLSTAELAFVRRAEAHQRSRRRRRRGLRSGLAVALVLALVLGSLFIYQQDVASDQAAAAASRALASASIGSSDRDPVHSAMLALAAYQREPTEEAGNALFRQYVENRDFAAVFSGAPGLISEVQTSDDGQVVASRTDGGIIMVWSRPPGEETRTIRTRPGIQAYSIVLVPDGSAVWMVEDGWLSRLNIPSGEYRRVIPFDLSRAASSTTAISRDGSRLAVQVDDTENSRVLVWDTDTGQRAAELPIPDDQFIWDFAFDAGARSLVLKMTDPDPALGYRLEVWDVTAGSRRVLFAGADHIVIPPNGEAAVVCGETGSGSRKHFAAIRLADGTEVGSADLENALCYGAADPTGRTVVAPVSGLTRAVTVLDLQSGAALGSLVRPLQDSDALLLPLLINTGSGLQFAVHDQSRVILAEVPDTFVLGVQQTAVLPDGQHVVNVVSDGAELRVDSVAGAEMVAKVTRPAPYWKPGNTDFAVSTDGKLVADRVAEDTVLVHRLPGLEPLGRVTTPTVTTGGSQTAAGDAAQNHVHFFDEDDRLVTLVGHELDWWDPVTGHRVAHHDLVQLGRARADEQVNVRPHPDASRIALVVEGRPDVRVLDVQTGDQVATIPVGEDVLAAQFQPGSPYLAIMRRGRAVELWDIGQQRRVLGPLPSLGSTERPNAPVEARFLDDPGEFLVADSGLIRVWRVGSAAPVLSLELGEGRYVRSSSSDGRILMYQDEGGGGGALTLDPQVWQERLCEVVGRRGFTDEERAGLPAPPSQDPLCP